MSSDAIDVSVVFFLYKIRSGYKITALAVAAFSKAAINMFGSNNFFINTFWWSLSVGLEFHVVPGLEAAKGLGPLSIFGEVSPRNTGTSFFHKGILSVQADTKSSWLGE